VRATREVTEAIEAYRFNDAANAIYRFVWNVYCDWYLELTKPILNGSDEAAKAETRAMVAWTLDLILKLLHPVSPFITEELWDKLAESGPARNGHLITEQWPDLPQSWIDPSAEAEMGWLVDLVGEIRSVRAEMNVPPGARPPLAVVGANAETSGRLVRHRDLITTLGRLDSIEEAAAAPAGSVPFVAGEATASLVIAGLIDMAAEQARLSKGVAGLDSDIGKLSAKLGNADFLARAREEIVEETREKLAEAEEAKAKLQAALSRLEAVQ
jgi:valyl-tRNA synthetase